MPNPFLEDTHLDFGRAVRDFISDRVIPHLAEWERSGYTPVELFPELGKLGWLGTRYPEEDGGSGGDLRALCVMLQEFYRASSGVGAAIELQCGMSTYPLWRAGSTELKDRLLRPALRGELIGAFATTESEAGSDIRSIRTTAQRVSDGYLLNGRKGLITNGGIADFVVVTAKTTASNGSGEGANIDLYVVEKGQEGFSVPSRLSTLGLRTSTTSELLFENCFVPFDHRLGEEGTGFSLAAETLDEGRIIVGCEALGVAEAALEAAIVYARERVQFGAPLGKLQSVQFSLADMATQVEAARQLCYAAAWHVDHDDLHGEARSRMAAMTKLFASEVGTRVARQALHLHGGWGYTDLFPVERYLRDAIANEIVEGASEIQRMIIGRSLLRDDSIRRTLANVQGQ